MERQQQQTNEAQPMEKRISKIDPDSWHYSLFGACKRMVEAFSGNDYWYEQPTSTKVDLCSYMRTIMIWAPLTSIAYLAFYGWLIYVAVVFPMSVAGGWSYLWLLICISAIAGGIALILGAIFAVEKTKDAIKAKKENAPPVEKKGPTFKELLIQYYQAVKYKICPILEVDDKEDA